MLDFIWELLSKIGSTAALVAILIFIFIVFYIVKVLFKNRKDIKGTIDSWIKNKNEEDERKRLVYENRDEIKNLKEQVNKLNKDAQNFWNNRVSDREKSREIQKELTDSIKALVESNAIQKKQIDNLTIADKELLADKINQKYKHYIELRGIPADEYDEFVNLHKAYNGVGGNHHGDAKYNYCIEHLEVIPVETKLVFENE